MPNFLPDSTVLLLLKRGIKRGWATLRRERGWVTIAALLGVVLLVQIFVLTWFGVQGVETLLRSQTDLRLQVQESATDRDVQEFLVALKGLSYIDDAQYITREQAYEKQRRDNPDLVQFLEQFKISNPFPDTIAVTLTDLAAYDQFAAFIKEGNFRRVIDPGFLSQATDQEAQLHQMLGLTRAGRSVAYVFLLLTGGVLLFVVIEVTRRRAFLRQEEVFVERMCGAQEASVIIPFATEAAVLLFLSIIVSILCLGFFLFLMPVFVPALLEGGTIAPVREAVVALLLVYGPIWLLVEVLLTPFVAFAGAYLGTRGGRGRLAMA